MHTDDFTVHIVDDEEAVRKSLGFMLTVNGFAVRLHTSATQFIEVASGLRDAMLVTDMRMPDMSGLDLIQRLSSIAPTIPSIVITGHGDIPMAVEAMKAGASDFIEKPFEDAIIIEAIGRAAQRLGDASAGPVSADDIRPRLASLSDRERQILTAVVAGQPNKAIAFNLDISPRTVEVHRANVMAKMKARSLPDLVRMSLLVGV
jgi:two-component system, LuxR family, response regulator FixJ